MRGGGRRSLGHSGEGDDDERCGVAALQQGKWRMPTTERWRLRPGPPVTSA
jgi:hypothetical protein